MMYWHNWFAMILLESNDLNHFYRRPWHHLIIMLTLLTHNKNNRISSHEQYKQCNCGCNNNVLFDKWKFLQVHFYSSNFAAFSEFAMGKRGKTIECLLCQEMGVTSRTCCFKCKKHHHAKTTCFMPVSSMKLLTEHFASSSQKFETAKTVIAVESFDD